MAADDHDQDPVSDAERGLRAEAQGMPAGARRAGGAAAG